MNVSSPSQPSASIARSVLIILLIALFAGLGFWLSQRHFAGDAVRDAAYPRLDRSALKSVSLFPSPLALKPFELNGKGGTNISPADLHGRWALLFFGFTHCPDVCPTTLARLAKAAQRWDAALPAESRPAVLFVSVDPERDSPDHAAEYAAYFDPSFLAGTNDDATLQTMVGTLGMVYTKVPLNTGIEGDYEVQHSASIVLIDPQGRRAGLIRPPFDPANIADDLIRLTQAMATEG